MLPSGCDSVPSLELCSSLFLASLDFPMQCAGTPWRCKVGGSTFILAIGIWKADVTPDLPLDALAMVTLLSFASSPQMKFCWTCWSVLVAAGSITSDALCVLNPFSTGVLQHICPHVPS